MNVFEVRSNLLILIFEGCRKCGYYSRFLGYCHHRRSSFPLNEH